MKKLTLIILFLWVVSSSLIAQMTTNKIVRTLTITSSNSALEVGYYFTAGNLMASATSPQAFTHSLINWNNGNSVCVLQNKNPGGLARFTLKDWSGPDSGSMGSGTGGSNIILHTFSHSEAFIKLSGSSGSSQNEIYMHPSVTTNTHNLVVGFRVTSVTNNSQVYQVNGNTGLSLSVTNIGPELGSSNVLVYAEGILTNKFTIP